MRTSFIIVFICISYSFRVYSQSFSSVKKADIWYDSEQDLSDKFQKSGSNSSLTEVEPDSIDVLNFHSVKSFSEEVRAIKSVYDISRSARLTVIVVFHSPDTLKEHGIWSVVRGGKQVTGLTDRRLLRQKSEYVYPVKRRGIPLINTSMQSFSKIGGDGDSNHFVLGAAVLPDTSMSSFVGDIAECYVFDRFLKKQEALQIETYLAIKYGITLIESDYISSSEVVLWTYKENKKYSNGMAGLGRDSVTGLNQKQGSSSEEDSLLTISVGNFSTLNKDNSYSLKEGNFIVWGHDKGDFTFDSLSSPDPSYPLMDRKWLLQRTKSGNKPIPTTVKFRLPENRDSTLLYYLAIDRSGSGNFGLNVEYFLQDSIDTSGYVYFYDIIWDMDGSGKDIFTFSCRNAIEEEMEAAEAEANILSDNHKNGDKKGSLEDAQDALYKLYPNPTTGIYKIEANLPSVSDITVKIYTVQGSFLEEWKSGGKRDYSYKGYLSTQGSYIIEVETSFGKKDFRLVVVE